MSLKIITLFLLGIWLIFWEISKIKSDKEKPKTFKPKLKNHLQRIFLAIPVIITFFQLLGWDSLNVKKFNSNLSGFGIVITIIGIFISIYSRLQLGSNWTGAFEYQIKKEHDLIKTGPYKYIRHPIYFALIIIFTGVQLVLDSYLLFPIIIYMFIWSYYHAKREEKILIQEFGKEYFSYQKKSKMLIPFLF